MTKAGFYLSRIALFLGVFRVGTGLLIAFGTDTVADREAASRDLLGTATTGEAIDRGILLIVAAIFIGILVDISKNTKAHNRAEMNVEKS